MHAHVHCLGDFACIHLHGSVVEDSSSSCELEQLPSRPIVSKGMELSDTKSTYNIQRMCVPICSHTGWTGLVLYPLVTAMGSHG